LQAPHYGDTGFLIDSVPHEEEAQMDEPRNSLTDDEIVTTPLSGSRSRAETGDADTDTDDTDVDTDSTDADADTDDPS
jgi:hypothetical protein